MHSDVFDRYHATDSFIHRLDPRVKVVVTVAFILSNALLPDGAWTAFGLSWLFLLCANVFAELGGLFTFKRSIIALPFALVAVTVLFSIPGNPVSTFRMLSSVGSFFLAGVQNCNATARRSRIRFIY